MWAIRGKGEKFGAATEFRLTTMPTPRGVFAGYVFFSFDQFHALSAPFEKHLVSDPLPTSCLITMTMDFERALGSTEFVPMIGIVTPGETHAYTKLSAEGGFSWLWDVSGGRKAERLSKGSYEEAVNTQAASAALSGLTSYHMGAFTSWHREVSIQLGFRTMSNYPKIAPSILVEPMHPKCFGRAV